MSDRFRIQSLSLTGLTLLERQPICDDRGFLERLFCAETFAGVGLARPILQINRTLTRRSGAIRGMHYQYPPHAEIKIVSCLRGEVFDVAIDLRSGSPTFLRWHGEHLSSSNGRMLAIPEGFAHGFQALTDDCEMLYCHTATYAPQAEGGISPLDGRVAVAWPLAITELSARDKAHPLLTEDYSGIVL